MKLSILIATTLDRRTMFNILYEEFRLQSQEYLGEIEILFEEDNKQISIGAKRQKLLERAIADYIVYFDSDDYPSYNYVSKVMEALEGNPDCVGFLIHMTTNNERPQTCCHSLKFPVWKTNVNGYDYVRSVTIFNPVRRVLALKAGFLDLRYGEDHDYSRKVTRLCKEEVFINEKLFHYRYTNTMPHKKKYGLK